MYPSPQVTSILRTKTVQRKRESLIKICHWLNSESCHTSFFSSWKPCQRSTVCFSSCYWSSKPPTVSQALFLSNRNTKPCSFTCSAWEMCSRSQPIVKQWPPLSLRSRRGSGKRCKWERPCDWGAWGITQLLLKSCGNEIYGRCVFFFSLGND